MMTYVIQIDITLANQNLPRVIGPQDKDKFFIQNLWIIIFIKIN